MIKVHFNGETWDMPTSLGAEDIKDLLKEGFPEIENAQHTTDEDGNITFRTASGEKGLA